MLVEDVNLADGAAVVSGLHIAGRNLEPSTAFVTSVSVQCQKWYAMNGPDFQEVEHSLRK